MILARTFSRLARIRFSPRPLPFSSAKQRALFQTTSYLRVGKESALHEENRGHEAERHKQDQLNEQKKGEGHWKQELASDSEESVKADRGETKENTNDIKKLQRETEDVPTQKHGQQK